MRVVNDMDTSFNNFEALKQVDKKAERKNKNKEGYKEKRNLIAVSKLKIDDGNILTALEKARDDIIKETGAIPRHFGIQNTVLVMLEAQLTKIESINDVKNVNFKKADDEFEKFIVISFPKDDSEIYERVVELTEQQRNMYKLKTKAFGVSNMVMMLLVKELVEQGYLVVSE